MAGAWQRAPRRGQGDLSDERALQAQAIWEALGDRGFVEQERLLKDEHSGGTSVASGHCYVASQVLYHLAGGRASGLKPCGTKHEGAQHWWLQDASGQVIDLTSAQFKAPVPYHLGRGRGFLTGDRPDRRARAVLRRVLRDHPEVVPASARRALRDAERPRAQSSS
jgi:hypothetical protein